MSKLTILQSLARRRFNYIDTMGTVFAVLLADLFDGLLVRLIVLVCVVVIFAILALEVERRAGLSTVSFFNLGQGDRDETDEAGA